MRHPASKHSVYFSLVEAMRKPGCYLCRLEQESVVRHLDSLLYESVNDPHLRSRLRDGGGFCSEHGHLLIEMGDALGIAILFLDQIQHSHRILAHPPRPNCHEGEGCPSCVTRTETRSRYLDCFADYAGDEGFHECVLHSCDLCLPHWLALAEKVRPSPILDLVRRTLEARLGTVAEALGEFIRKQDYRFSGEQVTPEQAQSWSRAVQIRVGWTFRKEELLQRR